jgi:predicted nucleic acid-binding protein
LKNNPSEALRGETEIQAAKKILVIGTAAIIAQAKKVGLISSARDVFEILHQSDFRISTIVIKTVLVTTGESDSL